ncbi:DsbA family protein, partial [Klebsiella pneumoniae]|uniref:DsbA family protein n=1 Tax=Klebsiella pneumoniae TaxID=573 RepID=UPI00210A38FD
DAPEARPPGDPASDSAPEVRGAGPLSLGEDDAPVVMVMYSEFQCPFCGKFARDTEPELVERFVDEGILRIEWRDLPYLGEESLTAVAAGRAAADQDAFWPFAARLYADQAPPNSGT